MRGAQRCSKYEAQEMHSKAVREDPCFLEFVLNMYKTLKMCHKVIKEDSPLLKYAHNQ